VQPTYPWYGWASGRLLEQGDILENMPVLVPGVSLVTNDHPTVIEGQLQGLDVVIISQTCDLAHQKINDVILCPHFDVQVEGLTHNDLKAIEKGHRPRYILLAKWDGGNARRIVDLARVLSVPKAIVEQFAESRGERRRLLPPYREHLAQAFARFYMRVALPIAAME
jgi:hypothetical protein